MIGNMIIVEISGSLLGVSTLLSVGCLNFIIWEKQFVYTAEDSNFNYPSN